eukprot:CAMPEP_0183291208 /NCGR_PEP_ID=MMETSP0160_2-20130417/702_1 /TAXON_ID=2839 ORGANISM="Odontella Sinensis, Strain Grunow 1884" /NCGR_SAMPLE_ID=MMETSP0160_2 /ASSEMBLY_ACC=CAM_ASM_000250 /LENGTH=282 /DNA_ID=CAMNT_0025451979 /DNA_START=37 /DNA_END=885 /DNA_ORIENTATION=+
MRVAVVAIASVALLAGGAAAFSPRSAVAPRTTTAARTPSPLAYSPDFEDDDFDLTSSANKPRTSFGAEAVPEEQRPANEYLDLIRQPLFGWADETRGTKGLAIRLGAVYAAFGVLICYPIAGATYTQSGYELNKLAAANFGAVSVVLVLLIRLYSGWGYVGSRLKSKVIEYEESGWYDGDIEFKTEAEKARDLFLYRQDVRPVEDRLKGFSAAVAALWIASIVGLNVASSVNPIFNEYDPDMLKTLQYDEKMANKAAEKSSGRPTYCDNRYYRAVANGGQGC